MTCRERLSQLEEQVSRFAQRVEQLYRQRAALVTILHRIRAQVPDIPEREAKAIDQILRQAYAADSLLVRARKATITPHGR